MSDKYLPTIGLEIHIELKTKTKMFCRCLNIFDEKRPNFHICPICLAHPGTLPVVNKEAILMVIKLGLALKGEISSEFWFDRKSYFYPDLPKGYQISQYEKPIVVGGFLKGVRIRRIHLEEDTGRLIHYDEGLTLVDFNRAGVPLMELVTEPDIKSGKEAAAFAKELQLILRYLKISDADMEKGQMRIEANVSLNKGNKVELKNINSFKAGEEAINYEILRQEEILKEKGVVFQETRGWNDKEKITEVQRKKESAHDYRYFPEPDLPPFDLSWLDLNLLKGELPELPEEKRVRFQKEFNLSEKEIEVFVENQEMADYFEKIISELKVFLGDNFSLEVLRKATSYFLTDLRGLMVRDNVLFSDLKITPEHFAHFIFLIEKGVLSSRMAKDLLKEMFFTGKDPESLIKDLGLRLVSEKEFLKEIAREVLKNNQKALRDYQAGRNNAFQFLIGQVMAKTKGQSDPKILTEIIKDLIEEEF